MWPFGTWMSKPSAINASPISTRKDSASILMVGFSSTNEDTGPAASIITSTAATMAATITGRSSTKPTAVMTESSENTTSITAICASTPKKPTLEPPLRAAAGSASIALWISWVALASRNAPPASMMMSRPEMPSPSTSNSSLVRPITQESVNSSRMRVHMATPKPSVRANGCWWAGSRLVRMLMKMTLSMPSTISRAANVAKASHVSGALSISIIGRLAPLGLREL